MEFELNRTQQEIQKDGDGWLINGTKTFITNGGLAAFYCVLCQTDTEASPSHRGLSVILVKEIQKNTIASALLGKMK